MAVSRTGLERPVRRWAAHDYFPVERPVFSHELPEEFVNLLFHAQKRQFLDSPILLRKLNSKGRRSCSVVFGCRSFLLFFSHHGYGLCRAKLSDVIVDFLLMHP